MQNILKNKSKKCDVETYRIAYLSHFSNPHLGRVVYSSVHIYTSIYNVFLSG